MFICSPFSHRQESKLQIFLFLFSLCSLSVELCDEVGSTADSCHRYCQATSAESYRHKKSLRDGPLVGGGGGGEGGPRYKKSIRARENKMKKIHARQLKLKNIHAMA